MPSFKSFITVASLVSVALADYNPPYNDNYPESAIFASSSAGQSRSYSKSPSYTSKASTTPTSATSNYGASSSTKSSSSSSASPSASACYFWMEHIRHQGAASFNPDATYEVFRNVKDFGAEGDGVTDDTVAIVSVFKYLCLCTTNSLRRMLLSAAATGVDQVAVIQQPQLLLPSISQVAHILSRRQS
jgi:hypothetical protein